jgi:aspartyl-tRNA(Asn)/glutamyl-tRNA(Gln) amidotransferase subunit A
MMQNVIGASAKTLLSLLDRGEISAVELVTEHLQHIRRHNSVLNAVTEILDESALAAARAADAQRASGEHKPLAGLPLLHKDNFCTRNITTSCASKMLADFKPPYDATVVSHLHTAGTVTLGKCNMDEFAMGSSTESSFYGPCKNPWDVTRVPGGSSGGSAAAVAAGFAPWATGTDTGGSIRQPASLCGVTGLKPTYGRVSRYGIVAFASSLDQAGPIARSVEDCAMMLNHIAGEDPLDATTAAIDCPDFTHGLSDDINGLRIGLPRQYFGSHLDPAVAVLVHAAIAELEAAGAILVDIDLPLTHDAIATYYVIAPAEASANLARYDGVRFGHRCADPADLQDLYQRSRSEGFGEEVQRRILVGTYALSAGSYEAYFKKAQQVRRLIRADFDRAFESIDLIAGPAAPSVAFTLGAKNQDPLTMYMEDVFTLSVNLAGLPGLSLPAGFTEKLPVGLQLIGRAFDEATVLRAGHRYQMMTDWHQHRAPMISGVSS